MTDSPAGKPPSKSARCKNCHERIERGESTGDWYHMRTGLGQCTTIHAEPERGNWGQIVTYGFPEGDGKASL